VQNALPPRFQSRAVWNANLSIINAARQFETTNGALRFPELTASPPMLLGRSIFEHSKIDGSINPAATETNFPLLYGDFQQMVIVDRIGSTLQLVPHLVGSNRRSTGSASRSCGYAPDPMWLCPRRSGCCRSRRRRNPSLHAGLRSIARRSAAHCGPRRTPAQSLPYSRSKSLRNSWASMTQPLSGTSPSMTSTANWTSSGSSPSQSLWRPWIDRVPPSPSQ
jgi:Phage capsid family